MATNVVVGAASGMGEAVARTLASRGPMLVADRDAENVARLATELGPAVDAVVCDLSDPQQIDELVGRIGPELDALVITAALSGSMAPGRDVLDVNLVGMARLLDAVEPLLAPGSVAVCFSSVSGHGVPEVPAVMAVLDDPLSEQFFDDLAALGLDLDAGIAYPLSKRGVLRMVRRLAPAWGARGARILSLSPGTTDTPMARAEMAEHPVMEELIRNRPLGRMGTVDEIASVVAFLTSDGESFMTGSDVLVDGGMAGIVPDTTRGALDSLARP